MVLLTMQPLQLYKHLLRKCNKLPEGVQDYYKHFVRQQFQSHSDETDPQRVKAISEQALKDMDWLLKKYKSS